MSRALRHADLNASYEDRASTYSVFGNGSLVGLLRDVLPPGGAILDLGCASGGLLAEMEGYAGRRVGVEVSASAANSAKVHADHIAVGDVTDAELLSGLGTFDVVVLADVLEHLAEPAVGLNNAQGCLAPGGRVVVSVPNIAHWLMRIQLLRGRWDYTESGVMDRGHLRFFTERSIIDEIAANGLVVEGVRPVLPRLRNHLPWLSSVRPLEQWLELVWQLVGSRRRGLMAFQFLVVARPA